MTRAKLSFDIEPPRFIANATWRWKRCECTDHLAIATSFVALLLIQINDKRDRLLIAAGDDNPHFECTQPSGELRVQLLVVRIEKRIKTDLVFARRHVLNGELPSRVNFTARRILHLLIHPAR